jgi:hypothetical protein
MNFIETPAPETNAPELINKNGFGLALHAGESERPAQVPTRPPGESRLGQSGGASTIGFLVRSLCSPSIDSQSKTFPAGEANEIDAVPRTQWRSNRVSSESLRKTGIFAIVAGDFCRNGPPVLRLGRSETDTELQKPANSGLFCTLRDEASSLGTAWLPWEDSNLHIPIREMPFEMSGEFPHFSSKLGGGDFCSCKLSILDTHASLGFRLTLCRPGHVCFASRSKHR